MGSESSGSFERLHTTVQQWIWQRCWTELRDVQERAIPLILDGKRDILISSATASGKTEAAFLPIASKLLEVQREGLALYVSPLKALINDQSLRLGELFESCDLPVYPWHGDVAASKKSRFETNPRGALLITPESLEGIFVRRGFYVGSTFRLLTAVVVDEVHSFINTERGLQLISLLCRLETVLGRRIQRIGLSATLGDLRLAAEFLRPEEGAETEIIESGASGQEVRLLVKGYEEQIFRAEEESNRVDANATDAGTSALAIARDLFEALRGSKNLAFANSRRRVEEFTDQLVRLCELSSTPTEFYAHHGSLSKALREEVESILKEPNRPGTAVCTSTLEMGIDIGQVRSVAQLDPPFSVASLRQRLGRSGRRGEPAVLRVFVAEPELHHSLAPQDSLRLDLFQAVAVADLLLKRWCEPPPHARLHLSTLVQQVLSLIAQYGGVTAKEAWKTTCQLGPFRNVDTQMFGKLLRELAAKDILMQAEDGTLLHAPEGEKIVNHYSFYTAFWTSEEFKLVHGASILGTLPISHPVPPKSLILFGGQRWRVVEVDDHAKVITVCPAHGGRAPVFGGAGGAVHWKIHQEMHHLYRSGEPPVYLDRKAASLFREGREQFLRFGLDKANVIGHEEDSIVFLWAGDQVANTLLVHLQSIGYTGLSFSVGLLIEDIAPSVLSRRLAELAASVPPDPEVVADSVPNTSIDRYDWLLPQDLRSQNYASARLDTVQAWEVLRKICGESESSGIHATSY